MKRDGIGLELKDYLGRRVVWYKESYEYHRKKHIELILEFDKFLQIFKNPSLKDEDPKRKCTHYFYPLRPPNKKGIQLYFEALVDYSEKPAFIRTAHTTSNTGQASIVYIKK